MMTAITRNSFFGLLFSFCALNGEIPESHAAPHFGNENTASASYYVPAFPVLLGKQHNPVLKLEIDADSGTEAAILQQILFTLSGDAERDVKSIKLFKVDDYKLIDKTTPQTIRVTKELERRRLQDLNYKLAPGKNTFWVTVELSDQATIKSRLSISDIAVVITGREHTVDAQKDSRPFLRLGVALRQKGQDGIHSYRIPGLATTRSGSLIAVYDNRYNNQKDLQEDIDVGMQRSKDGGQTWEPMRVIMDMGKYGGKEEDENGIGDPSILVDSRTGTIWVAGLWLHGNKGEHAFYNGSKPGLLPTETGQLMLVKSEDDGLSWSKPVNITAMIKNPSWNLLLQGPGRGITLQDGTLVFPAQFKDENKKVHSTLIYSKDKGNSWQIGTGAESETTEAQLVQLKNGDIMLNMRNELGRNGNGSRSVATTSDLGATWKKHPTSRKALPEPVCMASLISHRYKGQNYLVFSNPNESSKRRHNFTLKVSNDEGMSWPENSQLLLDEGVGNGYSCMTGINEDYIGVVYEGSQADLVYQVIRFDELLQGSSGTR